MDRGMDGYWLHGKKPLNRYRPWFFSKSGADGEGGASHASEYAKKVGGKENQKTEGEREREKDERERAVKKEKKKLFNISGV
jgi:hypothetical protein